MTASLFTEWYDEVFIPAVKKHQNASGKKGDVLLLVDNAQETMADLKFFSAT